LKFIFFILLCAAAYFFFIKPFLRGYRGVTYKTRGMTPPPVHDELVRDPVCGVFVPKRQAIVLVMDGKTHYFCSERCRKQFIDSSSRPSP
jgi:YHS domain-containing protein